MYHNNTTDPTLLLTNGHSVVMLIQSIMLSLLQSHYASMCHHQQPTLHPQLQASTALTAAVISSRHNYHATRTIKATTSRSAGNRQGQEGTIMLLAPRASKSQTQGLLKGTSKHQTCCTRACHRLNNNACLRQAAAITCSQHAHVHIHVGCVKQQHTQQQQPTLQT